MLWMGQYEAMQITAFHGSSAYSRVTPMADSSLFDRIDRRIALDREEGDYAYFNALMLKLEYITKIVVSGMVSCIGEDSDRHRYTLEHKLVRADSLGTWTTVLNTALVGPPSQVLLPNARNLARELTERVGPGDWRYECVNSLSCASIELEVNIERISSKVPLRRYFDVVVEIRNGTRGHGATTANQCGKACPYLDESLSIVTKKMKLFELPWAYLHQNLSGKYRVSPLLNDCTSFDYLRKTRGERLSDGVYMHLDGSGFVNVPLVFSDSDLSDIWLPNGKYQKKKFESLSYVTNDRRERDGSAWSAPPTGLPQSETEGSNILEPMGNTFSNVPPLPSLNIARPNLEGQLIDELLKQDRHPIVTLTGPGGIGKTTIALKAVHAISTRDPAPYEVILWISARDIDLLNSGPKHVSRRVFTQRDISRIVVDLMEPSACRKRGFDSDVYFQDCMSYGAAGSTLFVLDNFETLQSPVDTVEWLDTHIRSPNKVLITTRFRDFLGDYPIEIDGMQDDEALELIDRHAKWLDIDKILSSNNKWELVQESEGHPYVIKILLGQVAKEGKAVNPKRIIASSDNLLDALFRRTYNALSPAAQRVFLLLCSWRVVVPEVAVEAVSLRPETERFDVKRALDELIRFSLVSSSTSDRDNERFVDVPLAAAIYGRRELEVSPYKIAVEEDRKILMEFGSGRREDTRHGVFPRIENLIQTVSRRVNDRPGELEKVLPILDYVANRFPKTYMRMADLVMEVDTNADAIDQAKTYVRDFLRKAEVVDRHTGWMKLAGLCQLSGDVVEEIHAICEAALLPTADVSDLGNLAGRINFRIRDLKDQGVNEAWSPEVREFLERVAHVMEQHLDEFSGTECSRLAWLYLNIGNAERARDVTRVGLDAEPDNSYCQSLAQRLELN